VSGHTRWQDVGGNVATNLSVQRIRRGIIRHCEGYLDAMQDVLEDVDRMHYDAEDSSAEYMDGFHHALEGLQFRITDHITNAQATLDRFKEKLDGS